MKSHFQNLLMVLVYGLFACSTSSADSENGKKINNEQESAAVLFAKEHHKELAALLQHLKEMDSAKYQSAIRELANTNERLEKFRNRSPERYKTELSLWKIDSRVRLLVARSVGGMEDQTRQSIKELLAKRNEIRLDQFHQERERLRVRLNRIDEQISLLKENGEDRAEQEVNRLLKTATRLSAKRKKMAPRERKVPPIRSSEPAKSKTQNKTKPLTN